MARQERPVDPTAGPLESFAHDLRALRRAAGQPTYRLLARTAGYSASTLSEAAKGIHPPSLDVVLAYVGACGGDTDAWRTRWLTLTAALAATTSAPPAPPAQSAQSAPSAGPAPGAAATPACPAPVAGARFTAQTYAGGANIRFGAAKADAVLHRVPPGCTLSLTGWCVGELIVDTTAGTPDVRWFTVAGGGVVASAIVHGNPPAGLAAGACPNSRAAPRSIALAVDAGASDGVTVRASGDGTQVVGFAAATSDPARWEQIALTRADTGVPWQPSEPAVVAAVACLGGQAPTGVLDVRTVRRTGSTVALEPGPPLTPADRDRVARQACVYPRPG